MRVLDIITEAPQSGDPLDMLTVTGVVNAASGYTCTKNRT